MKEPNTWQEKNTSNLPSRIKVQTCLNNWCHFCIDLLDLFVVFIVFCFVCLFACKKQGRGWNKLEGENFSLGGCNFTCASSSTLYQNRFHFTAIALDGLFSSMLRCKEWEERTECGLDACPASLPNTFERGEVFSAATKKTHFLSSEILIGDIAADVAFRQQTRNSASR